MKTSSRSNSRLLILTLGLLAAPQALSFSVDGEGHYALKGETRTAPAFSRKSGTYQAIEQSFRLLGEARVNDMASMFLELRLFDNPREAYLGDRARPRECPANKTGANSRQDACEGYYQDSGQPGYVPYTPKITKAYFRYAFDYCIVEAGRRGRDWGLGMFLDSGSDPFDTDASIFDGISCDVNVQKSSTLGFKIGYDKLAETGSYIQGNQSGRRFGANDTDDDIDQYYFTIEYDDRKANAGEAFTKQIGVYFAQVNGRPFKENAHGQEVGGAGTDLKFLDLYTGFYFGDLALRNEILFRMGKSADPNWSSEGGAITDETGTPVRNKLDAIAVAGSLDWTLARSGAAIGPVEYNQGDASRHVLFFNYAYAPGDEDGYFTDDGPDTAANPAINARARKSQAKAVTLHRNFKPALLLFNARPEADSLIVDGAFNPSRVTNASVLGAGYRYESFENGNFEIRLVTASMNTKAPGALKEHYERLMADGLDATGTRPVGYFGTDLGWEVDLMYGYKVGREVDLGVAAAAAVPGKAWKTSETENPRNNYLLQTYATFRF